MTRTRGFKIYREFGPSPAPSGREEASIVIVGAGPVGLAMALDLGRRGHQVIVLNRLEFVARASKAICFSKRTLDIFDRLGVGDAVMEKGLTWEVGKIFWRSEPEPVYRYDTRPMKDQKRPGFINIQQYYVEDLLIEALADLPNVTIRWGHTVDAVTAMNDGTELHVSAAGGAYSLKAAWVIACDGSRSTVRRALGLDFEGRAFTDNFLIADIRMKHEMPMERWFWFDPPFNPGQSALMHKQPDDVWRLDFQLGQDIDREAAIRPENVEPYIRAMLGDELEFEREWYSIYTFQCRRMEHFVHGRTIFAGDAAHLVSPFGARGCNGGFADVDNLGWKLDLVVRGEASEALLDTYDAEATVAAEENLMHSTRSTDFLTPRSVASRALRDAVLELARDHEFARPLVNSGRPSTAIVFEESPLSTPDADEWANGVQPGAVLTDAPHGEGWLLESLGDEFVLVARDWRGRAPAGLRVVEVSEEDRLAISRLDLDKGAAYLVRPDQYVAARWKRGETADVGAALHRAKAA